MKVSLISASILIAAAACVAPSPAPVQRDPADVAAAGPVDAGRAIDTSGGPITRVGERGGGVELRFPPAQGLDLSRPGALSFWIQAERWNAVSPRYLRFVRVAGRDGSVFLIERDTRRSENAPEALIVGLFGAPGKRRHSLTLACGPAFYASRWHFVAVSWDAVGFTARVDRGPVVRKAVPAGTFERLFPARASWKLGDRHPETTLIADLRRFDHPLPVEMLDALFAAGPAGLDRAR